jgi:hypothetical protein
MKVLEDASRGVSEGARVALGELGLPVRGTDGVLIVFWKEK